LSSKIIIVTQYFDEDLLTSLGLLDDVRWLFAHGGMGKFLETRDQTYYDLTLEFLRTLNVEVAGGP